MILRDPRKRIAQEETRQKPGFFFRPDKIRTFSAWAWLEARGLISVQSCVRREKGQRKIKVAGKIISKAAVRKKKINCNFLFGKKTR